MSHFIFHNNNTKKVSQLFNIVMLFYSSNCVAKKKGGRKIEYIYIT